MTKDKFKKWIVVLLCGVYLFSMTSCKKKDINTNTSENENETPVTVESQGIAEFINSSGNSQGINVVPAETPYFEARQLKTFFETEQNQYSNMVSVAVSKSKIAILIKINNIPQNEDDLNISNYFIYIMNMQGEMIQEIDVQDSIQEEIDFGEKIQFDKNENLIFTTNISKKDFSGYGFRLYKIDVNNGNLIDQLDLIPPDNNGMYITYSDVLVNHEDYIFISGHKTTSNVRGLNFVTVFDETGTPDFTLDNVELGGMFGSELYSDGRNIFISMHYPEDYGHDIRAIDMDEQKFSESIQGNLDSMQVWSGNDGIYFHDNKGIYQFQPLQTIISPVFLWKDIDMDLGSFSLLEFFVLSEDKILVYGEVVSDDQINMADYQWYMMEKQAVNPNSGKKILRIGGYTIAADKSLLKAVYLFNQYSKDIHAEIFDYFPAVGDVLIFTDRISSTDELMHETILAGDRPDVFYEVSDLPESSRFEQYVNNGLFTDLKEKISTDSELIMSDFYQNILYAAEKNGHIYYMFPCFWIPTYVGERVLVGDHVGSWTLDELDKLAKILPENGSLFHPLVTNEELFRDIMLVSLDEFINWEEKKVHFDKPEFQKILKFVKTNSNSNRELDLLYADEKDLRYDLYPIFEHETLFFVEELLWRWKTQYTYTGYPAIKETQMLCQPARLIGIFNSSSLQEESWTFIKYLFSEEIQDIDTEFNIPVRKSSLEKCLEKGKKDILDNWGVNLDLSEEKKKLLEAIGMPASGNYYDFPEYESFSEEYGQFSKEVDARGEQFEYLLSRIQGVQHMDLEVWEIIREESRAFFEDEKISEEAAAAIQKRVIEFLNKHV